MLITKLSDSLGSLLYDREFQAIQEAQQGTDKMERLVVRVRGKVQGVWYRASEEASQLGLTGWAANRPDGSVEVCAKGRGLSWRGSWPGVIKVRRSGCQSRRSRMAP